MKTRIALALALAALLALGAFACTQESQNRISRSIQNWTGTNGVLDIYAGNRLVMRFIKIDKLTTAESTGGRESRAYRFGYGYLDRDMDYEVDPGEKKIYFEISDFSTNYVFYESPK